MKLIGRGRCCRVSALCVCLVKVTKIRLRKKNSNTIYFFSRWSSTAELLVLSVDTVRGLQAWN